MVVMTGTIVRDPFQEIGQNITPISLRQGVFRNEDYNTEYELPERDGLTAFIDTFEELYPEYKEYVTNSFEVLNLTPFNFSTLPFKQKDALNRFQIVINKCPFDLYAKDSHDNIVLLNKQEQFGVTDVTGLAFYIHYDFANNIKDKFWAKFKIIDESIFREQAVYIPELDLIVGTKQNIQFKTHPYRVDEWKYLFNNSPEMLKDKIHQGASLELKVTFNKFLDEIYLHDELYVGFEYSDIPVKIKTAKIQQDDNVKVSLFAYDSNDDVCAIQSKTFERFTHDDVIVLSFNKDRTKIFIGADQKAVRNKILEHNNWLTNKLKDHNEAEIEANFKLKEQIEEQKHKHKEEVTELKHKISTLNDEINDLQVQLKHYKEREELELQRKKAELKEKEIELEKEKQKKVSEMMDKKIKQEEEKTKQNKYKSSSEKMKYGHIIVTTVISAAAAVAGWIIATSSKEVAGLLGLGLLL